MRTLAHTEINAVAGAMDLFPLQTFAVGLAIGVIAQTIYVINQPFCYDKQTPFTNETPVYDEKGDLMGYQVSEYIKTEKVCYPYFG